LSVFPWVRFRSTKAAVKMHTLLDLRGNIPTFIDISDGKMHEVNVLDIPIPEAGRSNYSSNGSNSIFVSSVSTELLRTQSKRRYGLPYRFMSWLPS
jgi:hypothetical protein